MRVTVGNIGGNGPPRSDGRKPFYCVSCLNQKNGARAGPRFPGNPLPGFQVVHTGFSLPTLFLMVTVVTLVTQKCLR
jgi:hypothetical protein